MRKLILTAIMAACLLVLLACGNYQDYQPEAYEYEYEEYEEYVCRSRIYAVDRIAYDPAAHQTHHRRDVITLAGVVGESETRHFTLNSHECDFYVQVVYRGWRALPEVGDIVIMDGQLWENAPCCGPGFTFSAFNSEKLGRLEE